MLCSLRQWRRMALGSFCHRDGGRTRVEAAAISTANGTTGHLSPILRVPGHKLPNATIPFCHKPRIAHQYRSVCDCVRGTPKRAPTFLSRSCRASPPKLQEHRPSEVPVASSSKTPPNISNLRNAKTLHLPLISSPGSSTIQSWPRFPLPQGKTVCTYRELTAVLQQAARDVVEEPVAGRWLLLITLALFLPA